MSKLEKLASFTGIYKNCGYNIGETMSPSAKLAKVVADVIIESQNEDALMADYLKIKELEETGELYL